jgi:hypothetical protein
MNYKALTLSVIFAVTQANAEPIDQYRTLDGKPVYNKFLFMKAAEYCNMQKDYFEKHQHALCDISNAAAKLLSKEKDPACGNSFNETFGKYSTVAFAGCMLIGGFVFHGSSSGVAESAR